MRNFTSPIYGWVFFIFFFICPNANTQGLLNPRTQPQFINPLPVPSTIDGRSGGTFTIDINQFDQWLGLIDPLTQQHMNTKCGDIMVPIPDPAYLRGKMFLLMCFGAISL